MKTNGQIAYEAWRSPMLGEWGNIGDKARECWEIVAAKVLDAQECVHPWKSVVELMPGRKCLKCKKEI